MLLPECADRLCMFRFVSSPVLILAASTVKSNFDQSRQLCAAQCARMELCSATCRDHWQTCPLCKSTSSVLVYSTVHHEHERILRQMRTILAPHSYFAMAVFSAAALHARSVILRGRSGCESSLVCWELFALMVMVILLFSKLESSKLAMICVHHRTACADARVLLALLARRCL